MRRCKSSWLISLLLLAACSNKGVPPLSEAQQATFVVDPVTAEVTDASADPTFRGLTNARNFRFKACVKDVAVLQPIVGANFAVFDGDKKVDEQSTDPSGCLYWTEHFQFPPTADETYFEANRTLTATTVHKGSVSLPLAVDPWRKDADAFRDLRTQPRPAAIRAEGANALPSTTSAVLVDSLSVQLSFPQGGSQDARLDVAFEPKFKRLGFDGKMVEDSLSEGTLSLRAQLVAFHGAAAEALTAPIDVSEVAVHGGAARWSGTAPLLTLPSRDSLIELRFLVQAVKAPTAMAPAQGRLELGRLTGPMLTASGAAQAADGALFVAAPAPGSAAAAAPGRSWSFQLGKVSAERVEVLAVDAIGKPSSVEYHLLACLKNSLSLEPVLGEKFHLSDGVASQDIGTDTDAGCLRWTRKVDFDYAATPKPIRVSYDLTGLTGYYEGAHDTRAVDFVPWQIGTNQALLDEKFDGPPSPSAAADGTPPQLLATSAFFKFTGRSFEIDSNLNLGTVRRYRFGLTPAIRRMTEASGWLAPEAIQNGRFHVRFLLETTDLQNPRVVEAEELDADVLAGTLQADVNFHFADLTQFMGRLKVTIEIRPLNADPDIVSVPMSDTIDLLHDGYLSVAAAPGSLDQRMAQAPRLQPNAAPLPAQAFAQAFDLASIPDSPADLTAAADIVANGDNAALSRLCGLYYSSGGLLGYFSSYSRCVARPQDFLTIVRTRHVNKLTSSKLVGGVQTMAVSMQAMYNSSTSSTHSKGTATNTHVDANVNVGGEIPGLDWVGIKIGAGVNAGSGWSYTIASTTTQGSMQMRQGTNSRSLNVDQATFQIQADVSQCFTIAEKGQPQGQRFFHCAPAATPAGFQETYYFFYDVAPSSGLQDPDAPASQRPFVSLLRGSDRFQSFVHTLEDTNVSLVTDGSAIIPTDLNRGMAAGAYDGLFPGLVSDSLGAPAAPATK